MIRPRGSPVFEAEQQGREPPPDAPSPRDVGPRQDFIYTDDEFEQMKSSIRRFLDYNKTNKILDEAAGDGFVFGDLEIACREHDTKLEHDIKFPVPHTVRNKELVALAKPFKCVFHRAIDEVITQVHGRDLPPADRPGTRWMLEQEEDLLLDIAKWSFDGILTSGGRGKASEPQNIATLGRMMRLNGRNMAHQLCWVFGEPLIIPCEIIVGGGVRSGNIESMVATFKQMNENDDSELPLMKRWHIYKEPPEPQWFGPHWFHSSCLRDDETFDVEEMRKILLALK